MAQRLRVPAHVGIEGEVEPKLRGPVRFPQPVRVRLEKEIGEGRVEELEKEISVVVDPEAVESWGTEPEERYSAELIPLVTDAPPGRVIDYKPVKRGGRPPGAKNKPKGL